MERNDLKKLLAGFSIAGLVGAGITTVTFVKPAAAA
jgi:radical SAM modification target selenobiotic family peptide